MARHDPGAPGPDALWLAAQAVAKPAVLSTAQTLVARWGRSNDAALHARQVLERGLGADPERTFTVDDYRYAADCLFGIGEPAHGEVLEAIAATDAEFQGASRSWLHRYDQRPLTAAERYSLAELSSGQVVSRTRPGHGIDGGWYAPASYQRNGRPAVVVTSSAGTRFVVPFASSSDAMEWLANRSPEMEGPLRTTVDGPVTRPGREEEVLAWLLRWPGDAPSLLSQLSPTTWTTHLRAELADALRWTTERGGQPEYSVIGEAFARRLLRAPGPFAEEIGWPGMTRAATYMRRLAETPVTHRQATEAVGWLAKADAEALRSVPGPRLAPRRAPAAAGTSLRPNAGQLLQPPPRPTGPTVSGDPVRRI